MPQTDLLSTRKSSSALSNQKADHWREITPDQRFISRDRRRSLYCGLGQGFCLGNCSSTHTSVPWRSADDEKRSDSAADGYILERVLSVCRDLMGDGCGPYPAAVLGRGREGVVRCQDRATQVETREGSGAAYYESISMGPVARNSQHWSESELTLCLRFVGLGDDLAAFGVGLLTIESGRRFDLPRYRPHRAGASSLEDAMGALTSRRVRRMASTTELSVD